MSEIERLRDLQDYERYRTEWSMLFYKPYPKQAQFHELGATKRERAQISGNQLGKTLSAGEESAYHLTGIYPEWWSGRRWNRPVAGWAAGVTGESTRDNPQRILLGRIGQLGSGTIPKSLIIGSSMARGVPDGYENVLVRHASGGTSQLTFKAYSDGREKWQGESLDFIWYDEEPPEDIYSEGLTRTNATKGMVYCTFTPLLGMSEVVMRFLQHKSEDRAWVGMTIDDVEHYTEEEKKRIIAAYPAHEREARARGKPMLGSGKIFPIPQEWLEESPIEVPDHWYQLVGIDFGYDHPTAAVLLVGDSLDLAKCTLHVTKTYRQDREMPLYHAEAIKAWGDQPVAWPKDALQHDKGSCDHIKAIYSRHGVKMLSVHAQFPDERGTGVEAGLAEMLELMQTGRFKVDRNCHDWFEEFAMYHRKDGKVVKKREDLMSATRYAIMMWRYARKYAEDHPRRQRYSRPIRAVRSWMGA